MEEVGNKEEQFYLQDNRSYVGNDILWWAKDRAGYTTDLSKAHVFTRKEAIEQNQMRESDIPWPKAYVDARTRPAVDFQHVDIKVALQDTGIVLKKPEKPKKDTYRCECGRFVSEKQFFATVFHHGYCPGCVRG